MRALDAVVISCPPDADSLMLFDAASKAKRCELLVPRRDLEASPTLKACFEHTTTAECDSGRVDIADIPAPTMKIVVEFLKFCDMCPAAFNADVDLESKPRDALSEDLLMSLLMLRRFVVKHVPADTDTQVLFYAASKYFLGGLRLIAERRWIADIEMGALDFSDLVEVYLFAADFNANLLARFCENLVRRVICRTFTTSPAETYERFFTDFVRFAKRAYRNVPTVMQNFHEWFAQHVDEGLRSESPELRSNAIAAIRAFCLASEGNRVMETIFSNYLGIGDETLLDYIVGELPSLADDRLVARRCSHQLRVNVTFRDADALYDHSADGRVPHPRRSHIRAGIGIRWRHYWTNKPIIVEKALTKGGISRFMREYAAHTGLASMANRRSYADGDLVITVNVSAGAAEADLLLPPAMRPCLPQSNIPTHWLDLVKIASGHTLFDADFPRELNLIVWHRDTLRRVLMDGARPPWLASAHWCESSCKWVRRPLPAAMHNKSDSDTAISSLFGSL